MLIEEHDRIPKSEIYWRDRTIRVSWADGVGGAQAVRELREIYEDTNRNIRKEIEAFYGRYAKETELSTADVREFLNPTGQKSFMEASAEYFEKVKRLYSLGHDFARSTTDLETARLRVSRLQELEININREILDLGALVEGSMRDSLITAYEDGFYSTAFLSDEVRGTTRVSLTRPAKATIEKTLKEPWLGDNYEGRIWKNADLMVKDLRKTLANGFARGVSAAELAQDFAKRMDVGYGVAERLLRTEMTYIRNQAALAAYAEDGIERYEFLSTLDARTSEICQKMDGKVISIEDAEPGKNLPPLHPNCRSTTVAFFLEDEFDDGKEYRTARDSDGVSYTVSDDRVKYSQWLAKYADRATRERVLGKRVSPRTPEGVRWNVEDTLIGDDLGMLQHFAERENLFMRNARRVLNNDALINEVSDDLKTLVHEGNFSMRRSADTFNRIVLGGRFKSQFETMTSGGLLDHQRRIAVAQKMFGISEEEWENLPVSHYEKYGYLTDPDLAIALDSSVAVEYGSILINFKKDRLMNRTTMTVGDSLGVVGGDSGGITTVSNPSAAAFWAPAWSDDEHYYTRRSLEQFALGMEDEYEHRGLIGISEAYGYMELQYHGDLTVDDIESVAFLDSTGAHLDPAVLKILHDKDIPVYKLHRDHFEADTYIGTEGLALLQKVTGDVNSYLSAAIEEAVRAGK